MYIYLIKSVGENKYKIGSSKDPNKRIKQLQIGNGNRMLMVNKFESKHAHAKSPPVQSISVQVGCVEGQVPKQSDPVHPQV